MKKLLYFALGMAAFAVGCSSGSDNASTGGTASNTNTTPPAATNAPATTPAAPAGGDAQSTSTVASNSKAAIPDVVTYEQHIKPILDNNCVGCHGARPKARFDARTYASIMKGGEHKDDVVAGDPAKSHLLMLVQGKDKPHMPPRGPLASGDIQLIEAWIQKGAKEK
jgi:mono/diheme cytochrome c family protein